MTHPFFTIGHSSRSIDEFVALLGAAKVQLVVDVRTMPRSRINPQFNRDILPLTLLEFAIGYEHISALGGLRPRKLEVPPSQIAFGKILVSTTTLITQWAKSLGLACDAYAN
jgi:uncharacterized protein (DUF488 family)